MTEFENWLKQELKRMLPCLEPIEALAAYDCMTGCGNYAAAERLYFLAATRDETQQLVKLAIDDGHDALADEWRKLDTMLSDYDVSNISRTERAQLPTRYRKVLGSFDSYRLKLLADRIQSCRACALCDVRTNPVIGNGDINANVMLIGEAPGRNEDLEGKPFVGKSGKLLDQLLEAAGMRREDVYIANVVKCRPPDNRNPKKDEIAACAGFLEEQIDIVSPNVLAPLGNFATRAVLETKEGITDLHGRLFESTGRKCVPLYHPAATIYDRSKRPALEQDLKYLASIAT